MKGQFTSSSKTYAATLAEQLITKKYTSGGIREHILEMSPMANKLKTMDMPLPEKFIVQLVFKFLPKEFETFHVNYNAFPENWGIEKLIAVCVQEEDRLKNANGGVLAFQVQHKKKNFRIRTSSIIRDLFHQARISIRVALPDHLNRTSRKTGKIFQLIKTSV